MGVSEILGMSRNAVVCLYRDGERKLQSWVDLHRNLLISGDICGQLSYRYDTASDTSNIRVIHLVFQQNKLDQWK